MSRFRGRKAGLILLVAVSAALGVALLFQNGTIDSWLRRGRDLWAVRVSMPVDKVKTRKMRRTLVNPGWVQNEILGLLDVNGEIRVNIKVPEKMIGQVSTGLRAQVTMDGFPDVILPGVVAEIAPLPDPLGIHFPIQYTTRIKVDKGFPGIRPEMMTEVKIFLDQVDDVLSVPVQAVVHSDRMDRVAYQGADGQFNWRNVTLGVPIDGFVEVVQGFDGGELVALNPQALIREEDRRQASETPAKMRPRQEQLLRSGTYVRRVMTRVPSPSPRPPLRLD